MKERYISCSIASSLRFGRVRSEVIPDLVPPSPRQARSGKIAVKCTSLFYTFFLSFKIEIPQDCNNSCIIYSSDTGSGRSCCCLQAVWYNRAPYCCTSLRRSSIAVQRRGTAYCSDPSHTPVRYAASPSHYCRHRHLPLRCNSTMSQFDF